jgi:methyl-accepting chemotaxis protein
MGIRAKVLSGFLILACMLFLAGGWSVYELRHIGSSVQSLLDDNYRSINAARIMTEALEREDSAVLLLQSGQWKEGRDIIKKANLSFSEGFNIAKTNITISGEKEYVKKIETSYLRYKNLWEKPIVGTSIEKNLDWYFKNAHPAFMKVKSDLEGLMTMNDRVMYNMATDLKNRAHRAVMPGIIAILSALIFSFVFNYFVNYYLVGPIIRITRGIQGYLEYNKPFDVKIETDDEIRSLSDAIRKAVTQKSHGDES